MPVYIIMHTLHLFFDIHYTHTQIDIYIYTYNMYILCHFVSQVFVQTSEKIDSETPQCINLSNVVLVM